MIVQSNMDRWRGKVAVVTGASSGIGAALVKILVQEGLKVVGLARRVDKIKEIANGLKGASGQLYALKCDVTIIEEVEETFKQIKESIGIVQILVNNAGLSKVGTFTEGDPEIWKTMLHTNDLGPLYCSRQVLGQLKESKLEGHVINMNSIVGHYKFPGNKPNFTNAYSPSKNALTCINDILRHEMNYFKMPVKITSLSPGIVYDTEIHHNNNFIDKNIKNWPTLQLEDINNAVLYILGTPPHVHIQELIIRPLGELIV